MTAGGLPVFTFHALDRSGAVTSTSPEHFAATISRLVAAGFHGVDLGRWIDDGRPPVDRGFAVAFDDGLRSLLLGVETLERHRVSATIFLVSHHVGRSNDWPGQPPDVPREPTLDWSEVAELARRGFAFGAHSATHPRLDRLAPADLERELRGPRDAIASRLGRPSDLLAYPYGAASRLVRDRASVHYRAAFGTALGYAGSGQDVQSLRRIDAYYLRSGSLLDQILAGTARPRLAVRRGLRAIRRAAVEIAGVER